MGVLEGEAPADRLEERIIEIEIERLRDFRNHPFQIKEDQEMKDLMDSIRLFSSPWWITARIMRRISQPCCVKATG